MAKKPTKPELRRQIAHAETYLRNAVESTGDWAALAVRCKRQLEALKLQLKNS